MWRVWCGVVPSWTAARRVGSECSTCAPDWEVCKRREEVIREEVIREEVIREKVIREAVIREAVIREAVIRGEKGQ